MTVLAPPRRPPANDTPGPGSPIQPRLRRLYFGSFSAEVDESRCHGLYREHEPIALSDMPRRVLFALLRERPRPVIAKALLEQLWPPGANASNLAKQVRTLRRALGDEQAQRYIRTLNKEGYAFVMGVTAAPQDRNAAATEPQLPDFDSVELRVADGGGAPSAHELGLGEWRLAKDKLIKDFQGSCLHDLELLQEAVSECDRRIRVIVERARIPLEGRFPHAALFVPPRVIRAPSPRPEQPDPEVVARSAELVRYAETNPIVVNVGAYSTACIAVLQSMRRRYGLRLTSDFQDLSGRQQILRLYHDDQADFLLTPHAPFLLVGDHGALDYRRLTPVYEYSQAVLTVTGPIKGRKHRMLVYKGGSPDEQMMVLGAPDTAEVEIVASLEKLVAMIDGLSPGDMVVAWEPLASGLQARHAVERSGDYRLWISLYCHQRWQEGALRTLQTSFQQLFASEWSFCRSNRDWAIECLGVELNALAYFGAGSGLARL